MHDIAEEVSKKDIHAAIYIPCNVNAEVRHLSYSHFAVHTKNLFTGLKIRTCLRIVDDHPSLGPYNHESYLCTLLASWTCLRALDLRDLDIKNLPYTIGSLVHLRYLDLSYNYDLEVLPNSTSKLHNLETLRLVGCRKLRELPKDLSKLTKLRVLDASYCWRMAPMPRRMGKLSHLQKLPLLVVGERTSCESWGLVDQLEEIKSLKNIKGELFIQVYIPAGADIRYVVQNGRKEGYLSQHQHVTTMTIRFPSSNFDEELLEDLQPHPNLKGLKLEGYSGGRMPHWARQDNLSTFLPNLVGVHLQSCHKLQHVAVLRKLPKLVFLRLEDLPDLVYIEDATMGRNRSGVAAWESQESFFPSLEELELWRLPKLKGWWKDDSNPMTDQQQHGVLLPSFPRVSNLRIEYCPNLVSMPICPNVEFLTTTYCSVNLQIVKTMKPGYSRLRIVESDRVGHLKTALPMEALQCLNRMYVWSDLEVEILSEVEEVFRSCSSSLRSLRICNWYRLKSVFGGLKHLTALEKLELRNLPDLSLSKSGEGEEEDGMPWNCLDRSLRCLELARLPNMAKLPNGMRYLTALQSLTIEACKDLESIPKWMMELTSLRRLTILDCSDDLMERCHECTGEDWPNIQHVPNIHIY